VNPIDLKKNFFNINLNFFKFQVDLVLAESYSVLTWSIYVEFCIALTPLIGTETLPAMSCGRAHQHSSRKMKILNNLANSILTSNHSEQLIYGPDICFNISKNIRKKSQQVNRFRPYCPLFLGLVKYLTERWPAEEGLTRADMLSQEPFILKLCVL
jgi:hypothetical protein